MEEQNRPVTDPDPDVDAARNDDRLPEPGRERPPPAPCFAAVDLGTNNCRMLVGSPAGDGFRVLDSFSRIVRLGEGLHETGRLSEAAMARAIMALQGCQARLSRRQVRTVRAIATEACRQASNGAAFIDRARAETGLCIDIISTREEAELALESCAPLLRDCGRRALLFDIGGGSTEVAWVRLGCGDEPPQLVGTMSLPVGVVTLAERFGALAQTEDGFAAMVEDITAQLVGFDSVHCIGQEIRQGGVRLLGTSGTVTTLAGIALALPRYSRPAVDGVVLTRQEAREALAALQALGREGLAAHPCIGPDRAEFVLPGCAIFAAIQELWPAEEIGVADRGLREGMLLRMMRADARRKGRRTVV
jgi:exopolyphosphatase/guanosine-5'-triphosphate,3'-diphosphate pyrophosphatase